jgi:hypothetical protein
VVDARNHAVRLVASVADLDLVVVKDLLVLELLE